MFLAEFDTISIPKLALEGGQILVALVLAWVMFRSLKKTVKEEVARSLGSPSEYKLLHDTSEEVKTQRTEIRKAHAKLNNLSKRHDAVNEKIDRAFGETTGQMQIMSDSIVERVLEATDATLNIRLKEHMGARLSDVVRCHLDPVMQRVEKRQQDIQERFATLKRQYDWIVRKMDEAARVAKHVADTHHELTHVSSETDLASGAHATIRDFVERVEGVLFDEILPNVEDIGAVRDTLRDAIDRAQKAEDALVGSQEDLVRHREFINKLHNAVSYFWDTDDREACGMAAFGGLSRFITQEIEREHQHDTTVVDKEIAERVLGKEEPAAAAESEDWKEWANQIEKSAQVLAHLDDDTRPADMKWKTAFDGEDDAPLPLTEDALHEVFRTLGPQPKIDADPNDIARPDDPGLVSGETTVKLTDNDTARETAAALSDDLGKRYDEMWGWVDHLVTIKRHRPAVKPTKFPCALDWWDTLQRGEHRIKTEDAEFVMEEHHHAPFKALFFLTCEHYGATPVESKHTLPEEPWWSAFCRPVNWFEFFNCVDPALWWALQECRVPNAADTMFRFFTRFFPNPDQWVKQDYSAAPHLDLRCYGPSIPVDVGRQRTYQFSMPAKNRQKFVQKYIEERGEETYADRVALKKADPLKQAAEQFKEDATVKVSSEEFRNEILRLCNEDLEKNSSPEVRAFLLKTKEHFEKN